jgi:hypothetical protein
MVALIGPGLCAEGRRIMRKTQKVAATSVVANAKPAPVRVRLKRLNCDYARPYPPDGQAREWWQRLKNVLGTSSSHFVDASLQQLIAAARLPGSGISEIAVNSALAFIEAVAPRDEVEAALAIQMVCTHIAAMNILGRFAVGGSERRTALFASASAKLLRAYAMQAEVLRRLRHGGSQIVRVEHVHINEGGQAVIGNVGGRNHEW